MGERLRSFVREMCYQDRLIWAIFAMALTFLIVQAGYLAVTDPEPALYVVSVMNLVGFTAFAIVSGALLHHCRTQYPSATDA